MCYCAWASASLSIVCVCERWVSASVHCICVYFHSRTQPTVHLECRVRSPSLAGKQMEETWAPCIREIWCNRGIRSLQTLAHSANSEPLLSSNTKPNGWLLAIFKKQKKKTKPKICWEGASERSADSWDEGFDLILKLLECYREADIYISIDGLLQQIKGPRFSGFALTRPHFLYFCCDAQNGFDFAPIHPPSPPFTPRITQVPIIALQKYPAALLCSHTWIHSRVCSSLRFAVSPSFSCIS